jgi:hypothetical protein
MVKVASPWLARPGLPQSLIYVSRRIAANIVQESGLNPRLRDGGAFNFSTPFGGFGATSPQHVKPDYDNIYELAARATHAVADQTVTVNKSGPAFANLKRAYIKTTMHLQIQDIKLGVWERHHDHPVAAFAGYESFPGVGRVFLGMIGSAHNHLPEGTIAPGGYTGRTPSDAVGLYDIIEETRELLGDRTDPTLSAGELEREELYCNTVKSFGNCLADSGEIEAAFGVGLVESL